MYEMDKVRKIKILEILNL